MDRWAYFTLWARRDSRGAAAAFLSEATEEAASRLIGAAHWRDEDVRDFERRELGVLVAGTRWGGGRFWLAAPGLKTVLLPPAPRVAPSDVVALARAVVEALAN